MKSPSQLRNVSFPDCVNSCIDPDKCLIRCRDKVRDYDSINFVTVMLSIVVIGCVFGLVILTLNN